MNPQILIELAKNTYELNENPVKIEKTLVQQNLAKEKTQSWTIRLGSSTLIMPKTNSSQFSEAQKQQFFEQLDLLEKQKKLFDQIVEPEEPLTSSKYAISVRGGELGKSGPGPRAKADALKKAKKTGGGSTFAQGFIPQRQYDSRPAAANRLSQQFQTVPAKNGNGLFGRFSARPTPDPYNPGCAGGPRSITVRSSHDNSSSSSEQSKRTMEAHDGLRKKPGKLSAEEKYDSIRKSKTDVDAIAKNTGYKRNNVQNCKNHLFYDNHRLDRYESLGEPVEIKPFDANENQAKAWERLEKGTHTKQDLTWLKHEKAEQWYEKKHDAGYSESHEAAEKHWSGTPWTNTNMEDKK